VEEIMYDPQTGRWTTTDPIWPEDHVNPFVYVHNDPTNRVDPSGLQDKKPGTKVDLPETTHLDRLPIFGAPNSKGETLKKVVFWHSGNLPRIPKNLKKVDVFGGQGWFGTIPDGWAVGPSGCGPCVGVALIPNNPKMETYVLHFTGKNSMKASFRSVQFLDAKEIQVTESLGPVTYHLEAGPKKGYKAVLCGAEKQVGEEAEKERLHTLEDVVNWLTKNNIPIKAYVQGPGFAVDKDGTVYWDLLPGILVPNFLE